MSEVADATQIVVVAGKAIYLLGKISLKAAIQFAKLIHTIRLSKWKGKARLGRLRAIKGDDMMYVNVGSEDKKELKKIQKEMKQHGILFAKMPDLCGGDGRTQYAIAVSDAPKVRALLIDHAMGPFKDIYLGMLSEKDYLSTAFNRNGEPTPETQDLSRSVPDPFTGKREKSSEKTAWYSRDMGTPEQQVADLKEEIGDVRVRLRDLDCQGLQQQYQWISGPPVEVRENFAEYRIDQNQTVFIPVKDAVLPGKGQSEKSLGAALFRDRAYTVTNLQTATFRTLAGPVVIGLVKEAALNRNSGQTTVGSREMTRDQSRDQNRELTPGEGRGGLEGPTSALESLSSLLNSGAKQESSPFEKKL